MAPLSANRWRKARPTCRSEDCPPPYCWMTRGSCHEVGIASYTVQNNGAGTRHGAHQTAGSQQSSTPNFYPKYSEDVMLTDSAVTAVQGQGAHLSQEEDGQQGWLIRNSPTYPPQTPHRSTVNDSGEASS